MAGEKILAVDNNSDYLRTLVEFLRVHGFTVLSALDATTAIEIAKRERPDLAVLDIRLYDDNSDLDRSGLDLGWRLPRELPKIFLTGFPSTEKAREALKPGFNGISLAYDFIEKKEGFDELLRAIIFILALSPTVKQSVYKAMKANHWIEVVEKAGQLGPERSAMQIATGAVSASKQAERDYKQAHDQAAHHHFWALAFAGATMVLVLAVVALAFVRGLEGWTGLSTLLPGLTQSVSLLFIRREDNANKRVDKLHTELLRTKDLNELLIACDQLVDPSRRDDLRKQVIERFLAVATT